MTALLALIFFFSGVSALIFENLWFRLSGIAFGNSILASAIVLSSFMCGLALGNGLTIFFGHRIKSAIRLYAVLEIIIGSLGVLLVIFLPHLSSLLSPLFQTMLNHSAALNFARGSIAFLLMVIPATAMGATLPVIVRVLYAKSENFGRVLGILYGWNTLGAVAGVLACEMFLINISGISGSGIIAGCCNALAAFLAFWLSRKIPGDISEKARPRIFSDSGNRLQTIRILGAAFLSGFTLLALEVVWFRFMVLFFMSSSWNFAVMLAMVLAGISLGGFLASRFFNKQLQGQRFLLPVLILNGIIILFTYTNFSWILNLDFENIRLLLVVASIFLIFPVSLISGIVFTMLGHALFNEIKDDIASTGLLTLTNTTGGMAGSILAGLYLIPVLGIEKSFFFLAVIYGFMAIIILTREHFKDALSFRNNPLPTISIGLFSIFLVLIVLFPSGIMDRKYLAFTIDRFTQYAGEKKVAHKESITETIQYLRKDLLNEPYYYRLVTNNYSMSATDMWAKRYMKFYTYMPVAIHNSIDRALLVCFGCGITAQSLTETESISRIDIVDISRDIINMSSVVYPQKNINPVHNKRVKVFIGDGRFYLQATDKSYDLITAEPPPPKANGIVNLYSQEYFQLIRKRLSRGGIVTYWLPVNELSITETKAILKGFTNVFENASLWIGKGYQWMMLGIKPPVGRADEKQFRTQWTTNRVKDEMRALGFENPRQIGAQFIADGKRLQRWIGSTRPLTDNYPHRLTPEITDRASTYRAYRYFLNAEASLENFRNSSLIAAIIPSTIRKESEKYFTVRNSINFLMTPNVTDLHRCITDPLLNNYILWACESDLYAQAIISRVDLKTALNSPGSEIFIHLAAGAAQNKDFIKAAKYLSIAAEKLKPGEDSANIFLYRIYFLYITGNKNKIPAVEEEYINISGNGKKKRKELLEKNRQWLIKAVK